MEQDKHTKPDREKGPPNRAAERKTDNTTPSIYPDVDMVNRTLP